MNAKELREAAEYVVEHWDNHDKFRMVDGDTDFMNADGEPDAVTFARHILATVRDDDDEPIDLKWLEKFSSGPGHLGDCLMCVHEFGVLRLYIIACKYEPDKAEWGIVSQSKKTPHTNLFPARIQTRGQFRRLCEGLGIQLKEAT